MIRPTFKTIVFCDNCGYEGQAELSVNRHSVAMHDGRRIIPANGRVRCCPSCGSKHSCTHCGEGGLAHATEPTTINDARAQDDDTPSVRVVP